MLQLPDASHPVTRLQLVLVWQQFLLEIQRFNGLNSLTFRLTYLGFAQEGGREGANQPRIYSQGARGSSPSPCWLLISFSVDPAFNFATGLLVSAGM